MNIPLQISFHGIDHSDAVEDRIREKVAKLEGFFNGITSCRVVVESHHKNTSKLHQKGEPFHISVNVNVPGKELIVKRDPKESHVNEDVYVALRDAFQSMERQLKEYSTKLKDKSKDKH